MKTLLLIAGQAKAGTSSLFSWLCKHPNVSGGYLKELRFFLDEDYPLSSPKRFDGNNFNEVLELFPAAESEVLVDATPDYFACTSPLRVREFHHDVKVVIVVREPVSRLMSAYRFFKARGLIPQSMNFDQYILKQYRDGVNFETPVQYRSLDHCRTNHYLRKWRDAYGTNLLVLNFHELMKEPDEELKKIYGLLGLSVGQVGRDLKYDVINKTRSVKWPVIYGVFMGIRRRASERLGKSRAARKALSKLSRIIDRSLTDNSELEHICPSEIVLNIIAEKVGE